MKNKFVSLLIFTAFFSCNQGEKNKTIDDYLPPIKNDSVKISPKVHDDSLNKVLSPEQGTLIFNLKMGRNNQHVTVPVGILRGDTLFATLSSNDKNANIRISQIGFPDSTFDGPFGSNLDYKIKVPGNYKIIIGEDMMAGDRWNGNFSLKVWVK
jgi:hypothetical protein